MTGSIDTAKKRGSMVTQTVTTTREAAIELITHRISVLPCCFLDEHGFCACGKRHDKKSAGKAPLTQHGIKDSSTKVSDIWEYWNKYPRANIGIDLEKSGLLIIGPDSEEWDNKFQEMGLPPTTVAQTGGGEGHKHYYYKCPPNVPKCRINKSGMYDIQTSGYAVAPPSYHTSGRYYQWLTPITYPEDLPDPPAWAVEMLIEKAATQNDISEDENTTTNTPPDTIPLNPNGSCLTRHQVQSTRDTRLIGLWSGNLAVDKATGKVCPTTHIKETDRSSTLYHLAWDLYKTGFTKSEIYHTLRERDETLGFHKYSRRSRNGAHRAYIAIIQKVGSIRFRTFFNNTGFDAFIEESPESNFWQYGFTASAYRSVTGALDEIRDRLIHIYEAADKLDEAEHLKNCMRMYHLRQCRNLGAVACVTYRCGVRNCPINTFMSISECLGTKQAPLAAMESHVIYRIQGLSIDLDETGDVSMALDDIYEKKMRASLVKLSNNASKVGGEWNRSINKNHIYGFRTLMTEDDKGYFELVLGGEHQDGDAGFLRDYFSKEWGVRVAVRKEVCLGVTDFMERMSCLMAVPLLWKSDEQYWWWHYATKGKKLIQGKGTLYKISGGRANKRKPIYRVCNECDGQGCDGCGNLGYIKPSSCVVCGNCEPEDLGLRPKATTRVEGVISPITRMWYNALVGGL